MVDKQQCPVDDCRDGSIWINATRVYVPCRTCDGKGKVYICQSCGEAMSKNASACQDCYAGDGVD